MDRNSPTRVYGGQDGLPQEVINAMPQDPQSQLQLAFRITNYALNQRAHQLEGEAHQLRQNLVQKSNQVNDLERRVMHLESELNDISAKHKMAVEATQKLANEKAALINTVKKLNREVAKLEGFKRNLMNSLRDDDDPPGASQHVQQHNKAYADSSLASLDLSSDRLVSSVLASANSNPMSGNNSPIATRDTGTGNGNMGGISSGMHHLSMGSPREPSAPQSPRNSQLNTSGSMGSSPRIDGKEFFRQARARLSYEQFSQFLQNIKELNAGRQSREDTLGKARDIFGTENNDLFMAFEGLLSRHLPAM